MRLLLLIVTAACLATASRVCVLVEQSHVPTVQEQYSKLWRQLSEQQGQNVAFVDVAAKDAELVQNEQLQCEHAFLMAPEQKKWPTAINREALIDFTARGGNLLIVAAPSARQPMRELAAEFGFDLQPAGFSIAEVQDGDIGKQEVAATVASEFPAVVDARVK